MKYSEFRPSEKSKAVANLDARERRAREAFGDSEFTIRDAMGAFDVGYEGAASIMRALVASGVVASRKRGVFNVFCFDLSKETKARPRERVLSDEDLVSIVDAAIARYAKTYPRRRTFDEWNDLRGVAEIGCLGSVDSSYSRLEQIEYLIRRCVFKMRTHEKTERKIRARYLNASDNYYYVSRAIDRANDDLTRARNSVALWGACWDFLLDNADETTLETFREERPYSAIARDAGIAPGSLLWKREQVVADLALNVLNVRFGKYWRKQKREWFDRCDEVVSEIVRGDAPIPSRDFANVELSERLEGVAK